MVPPTTERTWAPRGDDVVAAVESVTGGSGDDALTAGADGGVLTGNGGLDTLTGAGGNDTLIGGAQRRRHGRRGRHRHRRLLGAQPEPSA